MRTHTTYRTFTTSRRQEIVDITDDVEACRAAAGIGEGFVLVYSISSRTSFEQLKIFYNQIRRVKESSGSPTFPGALGGSVGPAPIMLVGNKCDRVTERAVSTQEGSALARELGCEFIEASAKNCVNVERAFYDVVRQLRRQRLLSLGGAEKGSNKKKDNARVGDNDGKTRRKTRSSKCVIL